MECHTCKAALKFLVFAIKIFYLEISDPRLLPLQQSLKLEIWFLFVKEDHLRVDVLPGGVVEVVDEVSDADEGDVPAHDHKLLF